MTVHFFCVLFFPGLLFYSAFVSGDVFVSTPVSQNLIWEGSKFPNPLSVDDFRRCNIPNTSFLCDPDHVLSTEARKNVIVILEKLNNQRKNSSTECKNQGIIAGVAIARKFDGGKSQTLKSHARYLLNKWKMDKEDCEKSLIIVLAVQDRSFWISKESKVEISPITLNQYFNDQKQLLRNNDFEQALINVIQELSLLNKFRKDSINASKAEGGETSLKDIAMIISVMILIFFIFCLILCRRNNDSSEKNDTGNINSFNNINYQDSKNAVKNNSGDAEGGGGDW